MFIESCYCDERYCNSERPFKESEEKGEDEEECPAHVMAVAVQTEVGIAF